MPDLAVSEEFVESMESPVVQPERNVGRIIARNTAFGLASQVVLKIIGFLFNVLVINRLGDSSFGQYSIVLSWATLFAVLGDLGIAQFYTREIARNRDKASEWFWDVVVLRFCLAILASAVTTGGAIVFGYSTEIVIAIGLYTSTYYLQALLQPLVSIIEGNERIDITSVFAIIAQVIFMGSGAIFLFLGGSFVWLVVASLITIPLLIVLCIWVIRKNKLSPPAFQLKFALWKMLVRGGLPFAMIQVSLSFAFQSDNIFLSKYGYSDQQVGWYSAAYSLMLTASVMIGSFNRAILPSLAREHEKNPDSIVPWYYRSVKALAFIGMPVAVGGMLLSDKLIGFLYPEYPPASIAFAILIWYIPMHLYTAFSGNLTTSIKKESSAARIFLGEGLVNVALNFVLIPPFGVVGASFATLLTEVFGSALFYVLFRRTFGPGLNFKKTSRLAFSALLMGVVVFLLRDLGLGLGVLIAIGAVFYLLLVWLTRAFSQSELEVFKTLFQRVRLRLLPS